MFKPFLAVLAVLAVVALGLIAWAGFAQTDQLKQANNARLLVKATAKSGSANYYNEKQLQDDVVSAYNSTPPRKHHVESSTCVINGRSAICLLRTRTINIVSSVTLSADGKTFVATTKE